MTSPFLMLQLPFLQKTFVGSYRTTEGNFLTTFRMTAFVVTWIFSPSFSEKAHLPAPLKNGLDSVQSDVFKGFSGTSRKMMTFLLCFRRSLIVSSSSNSRTFKRSLSFLWLFHKYGMLNQEKLADRIDVIHCDFVG